jgi:hypothetical protein
MAQQPPMIEFEDLPLDEARRMSRGPRMDPELYRALRENIQSLDNTASRMPLPDGTSPTTMKNRILRVAAELGVPVTIRRVPGGLIFWRSTDEDRQQATDITRRTGRQTWPQPPGRWWGIPLLRPLPAMGHDAEILDAYDPYIGYDADTCPPRPPQQKMSPTCRAELLGG